MLGRIERFVALIWLLIRADYQAHFLTARTRAPEARVQTGAIAIAVHETAAAAAPANHQPERLPTHIVKSLPPERHTHARLECADCVEGAGMCQKPERRIVKAEKIGWSDKYFSTISLSKLWKMYGSSKNFGPDFLLMCECEKTSHEEHFALYFGMLSLPSHAIAYPRWRRRHRRRVRAAHWRTASRALGARQR
jgi:hypothetical protein